MLLLPTFQISSFPVTATKRVRTLKIFKIDEFDIFRE